MENPKQTPLKSSNVATVADYPAKSLRPHHSQATFNRRLCGFSPTIHSLKETCDLLLLVIMFKYDNTL